MFTQCKIVVITYLVLTLAVQPSIKYYYYYYYYNMKEDEFGTLSEIIPSDQDSYILTDDENLED